MFEPGSSFSEIINEDEVARLGAALKKTWPKFDRAAFKKACRFNGQAINERIRIVNEALQAHLPEDFQQSVDILLKSLPPELADDDLSTTSGGFIIAPQTMFIAARGQGDFKLSMHALEEMTKRFSSESAIRYFITAKPKQTMAQMRKWAKSPNLHVRRLASEGCRPRLPWTMRLQEFVANPAPVLEVLELLKLDEVEYVRRSVANNLNDIAKDNPEAVLDTLERWNREHSGHKSIKRITSHALRTLLKQGNHRALALMGYPPNVQVTVSRPKLAKTVAMGGELSFQFSISPLAAPGTEGASRANPKPLRLMIDYKVEYMKASGKTAPKVFKLSKATVAEKTQFKGRVSFKPISTRKFYPGRHFLTILVNGQEYHRTSFEVR